MPTADSYSVCWNVHVLAPYALVQDIDKDKDDIDDPNNSSYYRDVLSNGEEMVTEWTPELRAGIERAIKCIPCVVSYQWHPIGLASLNTVLDKIVHSETLTLQSQQPQLQNQTLQQQQQQQQQQQTVVLNLTDGMEVDGWPGISVIRGLESRQLAFTGADSILYHLDSDKARIKQHLIETQTSTPGYVNVFSSLPLEKEMNGKENDDDKERQSILEALEQLTFPLLVKPANSSSSRGISSKSVVDTAQQAYDQALEIRKVWGPVYVEEYITGREFTALVSGSSALGIETWPVLERVFRQSSIPDPRERLLTYEMKWGPDQWGKDGISFPKAQWWMEVCSDQEQVFLQRKAKEIFEQFEGNGYCRMDLRQDDQSGQVYVVDVNANCSIDESEDCAMGQILKAAGFTLSDFLVVLMEFAIKRKLALVSSSLGNDATGTKGVETSLKTVVVNQEEEEEILVSASIVNS